MRLERREIFDDRVPFRAARIKCSAMLTSNLREQHQVREDDVGRTGRLQKYTGKDSTNRRRLPELWTRSSRASSS